MQSIPVDWHNADATAETAGNRLNRWYGLAEMDKDGGENPSKLPLIHSLKDGNKMGWFFHAKTGMLPLLSLINDFSN